LIVYCQQNIVPCPGHIMQFINYGNSQYIKKVLELVEINSYKIE